MFGSPPPLAPMSELQQPPQAAAGDNFDPLSASTIERRNRHPQDLGAALASLNESSRSNVAPRNSIKKDANIDVARLFLEEPMEEGLGVGHFEDAEDEVLSVQHHEKRPKRSSLIERSKAFQEKLNNFINDYPSKDTSTDDDISPMTMMEEDDTSNQFPTRPVDLRHVDQSVNLMDTESARYQYSDDEDQDQDGGGYDDDDDDDVYANYTQGFTTSKQAKGSRRSSRRASRRGSLQMVVENGIDYLVKSTTSAAKKDKETIELPSGPTKKLMVQPDQGALVDEHLDYGRDLKQNDSWSSRYSPCVRWFLVLLLFLITAVWFVFAMHYYPSSTTTTTTSVASPGAAPPTNTGANQAATATVPPPPSTGTTVSVTHGESLVPPTNAAGDTERRRLVLEHVLQESLLKEGHDRELDPSSPSAQKAMEWMAGHDAKSMALLDAFHYEHDIKTAANLRTGEDVLDPANHVNKIVDRYVEAVFYFVAHPDATIESLHL